MALKKIELKTKQWDVFFNKFTSKNSKRQFFRRVGVSGEGIIKDVNESAKVDDTGGMGNSISPSIYRDGVEVVVHALYSFIAMEVGRSPSRKLPPVKPLQAWARRRGLGAGAGFAIAKSIQKKGTKKFRKKGPKLLTKAHRIWVDDILRIWKKFFS